MNFYALKVMGNMIEDSICNKQQCEIVVIVD